MRETVREALAVESDPRDPLQVFAERATDLIAAACRFGTRPVILLPALFCSGVADAIEMLGLHYRCYDIPEDLTSPSAEIVRMLQDDVGTIVVFHPFGLSRPFTTDPGGRVVVEDACHALRTAQFDDRIGGIGAMTVYSPRKELNWQKGGFASGPLSRDVKSIVGVSESVRERWREVDVASLAVDGLEATRRAKAVLGDRLPALTDREVLTVLPLKSTTRDLTIERLRSQGILAWRWFKQLRGVGPETTPMAWKLSQEMLLVPFADVSFEAQTLEVLLSEDFLPWPQC
jgi:hypothetical protein